MNKDVPTPRRQQILEALAQELELSPASRITTAQLARVVGVSEAALYRHFPSKAKMFEALIVFAEDAVFGLTNRVLADESDAAVRCEKILAIVLGFSEKNPGITRILLGAALVGESEVLYARVGKFFNRIETQLKQVLREGEQRSELRGFTSPENVANLLLAIVEGRMVQFRRSRFRRRPTENWDQQWSALCGAMFRF